MMCNICEQISLGGGNPATSDFFCAAGNDGFQVNGITSGNQVSTNWNRLPNGNLIIFYTSPDAVGSGTDVYARIFSPQGIAVSPDFRINETTTLSQINAASTLTNDGKLLVTWRTVDPADTSQGHLLGRFFELDGTPVGPEQQISQNGADGSYSFFQRTSNGAFVFAYVNDGEIYGRVLTQSGATLTPVGSSETLLGTALPGTPSAIGLQSLSNGNVVLRYSSPEGGVNLGEVRRKIIQLDSSNNFVFVTSPDAIVNSSVTGDQTNARSIRLANGNVVMIWQSTEGDGSDAAIRGRVLSADGLTLLAQDFTINTTTLGNQINPGLLAFDDGRRLAYWLSQENGDGVVRGRWFAADDDSSTYGADTAGSPVDGTTSVDWSGSDFVITRFVGNVAPAYDLMLTSSQRLMVRYNGAETGDGSGQGIQAAYLTGPNLTAPFPSPDGSGLVPESGVSPFDHPLPSFTSVQAGEQITRNVTTPGNNFNDVLGSPHTLTYAYRATNAMPSGFGQSFDQYYYSGAAGASGFAQFNAAQIAQSEIAIGLLEDVANVDLVRVQDFGSAYSDDANLLLWNYPTAAAGSQAANAGGFGYRFSGVHPSNTGANGYTWRHFSFLNDDRANVVAPTIDNGGLSLLLHEIGHTIGLSHPGNYNISASGFTSYVSDATYREDTNQYTVMSYFDESITHGNFGSTKAATPLLHDIAALQRLYGANMSTRTGDTVYGFNSNTGKASLSLTSATDQRVFAIWDAGGTDTLDVSLYSQAQVVSLEAEKFSSIGGLEYNVVIAQGATIENAITGSGNDRLFGNAVSNGLFGGAGNDTLSGLGGNDALFGGEGNDTLDGGEGDDNLQGGAGADSQVGGTGFDIVRYDDAWGVQVDILYSNAYGSLAAGDRFSDIEGVSGSNTDDGVWGTNENNTIFTWLGNDYIDGRGGVDVLLGGANNDTLVGGADADYLAGEAGADVFRYTALTDSNPTAQDYLPDFSSAQGDRIDISALRGGTPATFNTGFGTGTSVYAFSQSGGAWTMVQMYQGTTLHLQIVVNVSSMTASDFVL